MSAEVFPQDVEVRVIECEPGKFALSCPVVASGSSSEVACLSPASQPKPPRQTKWHSKRTTGPTQTTVPMQRS